MASQVTELPGEGARDGGVAAGLGRTLERADALLACILAAAWGVAAAGPGPGAVRGGLAVCAVAALLGLWPRAVTAVGILLSALVAPGVALVGAGLLRWLLRSGESGALLAEIRRERHAMERALVETEALRARGDLRRAGDAFERAGRARSALRRRGIDPVWSFRAARALGRGLARLRG